MKKLTQEDKVFHCWANVLWVWRETICSVFLSLLFPCFASLLYILPRKRCASGSQSRCPDQSGWGDKCPPWSEVHPWWWWCLLLWSSLCPWLFLRWCLDNFDDASQHFHTWICWGTLLGKQAVLSPRIVRQEIVLNRCQYCQTLSCSCGCWSCSLSPTRGCCCFRTCCCCFWSCCCCF